MTDPRGITPLTAFVDSLGSASHTEFAARAESRVAHEDAFDAMRDHILGLYDGVSATHSFADEQGAVFDCIPVEQQPALRGSDESITEPPDLPPLPSGDRDDDERTARLADLVLGPERTDLFGNTMNCPEGSIPMRRVTLEDMTRFATVRDFMRKSPLGSGRPPREDEPPTVPVTHRWAHAYQNVANGGGQASLASGPLRSGPIRSSHFPSIGTSAGAVRTCRRPSAAGRSTRPSMATPVLTCLPTGQPTTTPRPAATTCRAPLVQIGTTFAPGMALGPVSVSGGAQYEIELAYWLADGRWYLYFNGTQGSNVIGYYPSAVPRWRAGQAGVRDRLRRRDHGDHQLPAHGQQRLREPGLERAAYHRAVGYWPPPGEAIINPNLTASQPWPGCYTAQLQLYAAPWSETLWFGGPGGSAEAGWRTGGRANLTRCCTPVARSARSLSRWRRRAS